MACDAFMGGYEIDPSRPTVCQMCERPHSEHLDRMELPKVRVRGFDRLFEKLATILEDKAMERAESPSPPASAPQLPKAGYLRVDVQFGIGRTFHAEGPMTDARRHDAIIAAVHAALAPASAPQPEDTTSTGDKAEECHQARHWIDRGQPNCRCGELIRAFAEEQP